MIGHSVNSFTGGFPLVCSIRRLPSCFIPKMAVGFVFFFAVAGCAQQPETALPTEHVAPTLSRETARLAAMKEDIEDFIGQPRCSRSSQCSAVGFGSKPCGGPWTYLIYSITSVDETALLERVNEYNEYNRAVNERHDLVSDCMLVTEPRLDCVNGLCVVQDRSP